MYPNEVNSRQGLISTHYNQGPGADQIEIEIRPGDDANYPSHVMAFFRLSDGSSASAFSTSPLAPNMWSKVAVERTSDLLYVWLNGVRSGGETMSGALRDDGYDLLIGKYSSWYLTGYMDSVRFLSA